MPEPRLRAEDLHRGAARRPAQGAPDLAAAAVFVASVSIDFRGFYTDGETVVVEARMQATLAHGGHYDNDYCFIFELENGLIKRVREYMDTQRGARWFSSGVGEGRADGRQRASSRSRAARSAPAKSTIFLRLAAPATRVTACGRTPNAAATAAKAAAVALPSTAGALTRTISAPSCSPPTPGRADPGRTQMVIRITPV